MISILPALAGFYHPADVAVHSESFQKASARSARAATDAQSRARAYARALRDFEASLDLLGALEPEGQRGRLEVLEKQYNRDFARLQAFADVMVEDFDGAFVSALERILADQPDAARCQGQIPTGPRLPGIKQRTEPNPECKGEDLNVAFASAMDADPVLKAELKTILAREWPDFDLETQPVAPVGGDAWVSVSAFFDAGMRDTLRSIDRLDEEARIPFEAAIEQGASVAELEQLKADAAKVDATTQKRRADAAADVIERAGVVLGKQDPPGGWCAQPALLGGCTGTEQSGLVGVLLDDKKIAKLLRR